MSAHSVNNSQCDLNMYGPDPGDGSVKCTCDEDAPIEPAVGPPRPVLVESGAFSQDPQTNPRAASTFRARDLMSLGDGHVVLVGRAATTHTELRAAGQELKAAQELYRKAEQRWKQALDAHMQELA